MERLFTLDQYRNAVKWASEIIYKIESYEVLDWLECKKPDFYCMEICGVRKECPNGKK